MGGALQQHRSTRGEVRRAVLVAHSGLACELARGSRLPPLSCYQQRASGCLADARSGRGEMGDGVFDEEYVTPFERDYGRFRRALTSEVCMQLLRDGFCVVDDFLGIGWSRALVQEMKWLVRNGVMNPNQTQFTRPDGSCALFTKPHIFECDLHDDAARAKVPELRDLFEQTELVGCMQQKMPNLGLVNGAGGVTLKLQFNEGGGGCFPCHYDNPGRPNQRSITCLLYLNEEWEEGDGGEIVLMPFLKSEIKVPPKMDRCVLFRSDRVLHRVLPNKKPRYALTVWIDGEHTNTDADCVLRLSRSDLQDWMGLCERFRQTPLQRLVSRGVYEEEYCESLEQCMREAPEQYQEMKRAHDEQLAQLRANKGLWGIIEKLRNSKLLF